MVSLLFDSASSSLSDASESWLLFLFLSSSSSPLLLDEPSSPPPPPPAAGACDPRLSRWLLVLSGGGSSPEPWPPDQPWPAAPNGSSSPCVAWVRVPLGPAAPGAGPAAWPLPPLGPAAAGAMDDGCPFLPLEPGAPGMVAGAAGAGLAPAVVPRTRVLSFATAGWAALRGAVTLLGPAMPGSACACGSISIREPSEVLLRCCLGQGGPRPSCCGRAACVPYLLRGHCRLRLWSMKKPGLW